MALHNKYDTIIVGHNYPALILSKILIKTQPELLMIDDERVQSAGNWAQELSLVDLKLLKKIGEYYELAPLKNLDQYIQIKPWFLRIGMNTIRLGGSVGENVQELKRKLGNENLVSVQMPDNFEDIFNDYCERVVTDIWNLKLIKNWDTVLSTTPVDEVLGKILTEAEKLVSFSETTASLSYLLQAIHHRYVTNHLSSTQKRFLSLRLLSPRYRIDHDRLLKDLDLVCGHSVKESLIKNWQFRTNEKSVLLESYEGVVKSKRILYVGEFYKDLPFIFKVPSTSYSACTLRMKSTKKYFSAFTTAEFFVTSEENLGKKIPFMKLIFSSESELRVTFPLTKIPGDKLNFNFEEAKKQIFDELANFIPLIDSETFTCELSADQDSHIELINFSQKKAESYDVGVLNFGELMEIPAPLKMTKLKDLDYWGQFRGNYLGIFSFFMEAKLNFDRSK